jgi:hypothetical protein
MQHGGISKLYELLKILKLKIRMLSHTTYYNDSETILAKVYTPDGG